MKPHATWTNAELAEALPLVETVSPIDREICREAARRLLAAEPRPKPVDFKALSFAEHHQATHIPAR